MKKILLRLALALIALVAAIQGFRLLVRPSGVLLFVILAYAGHVRFIEKRPVTELRPAPRAIALGGLAGTLLISLPILMLFATGVYVATAYHGPQHGLWGMAGFLLIAATLEEVAYRDILFRILEPAWGTMADARRARQSANAEPLPSPGHAS